MHKERQVALILDVGLETEHQTPVGRVPFVVGPAVTVRLTIGHTKKPGLEASKVLL